MTQVRHGRCHLLTWFWQIRDGVVFIQDLRHIWTAPLCKVIRDDDQIGYSCGHICGFVGKYGALPALMDSARALLNTTKTSEGHVAKQDLRTPV